MFDEIIFIVGFIGAPGAMSFKQTSPSRGTNLRFREVVLRKRFPRHLSNLRRTRIDLGHIHSLYSVYAN